ncbi:MAG: hypothetical protein H0W15_02100 [Gemmatimonadales bacterium]|nr:hypothetical protein [Gemmatimonadales bacterium]
MSRSAGSAASGLLLVVLAACRAPDRPDPPTDTTPPVATTPASPDAAEPASQWRLTPQGLGPVVSGMPLSDIAATIGASPDFDPAERDCGFLRAPGAPAGVAFMIVAGHIARVDVTEGAVRTVEGAGIGTTESELRTLYAGHLTEQPHKYTDGRYLIVSPAGPDSTTHRVIFETDGKVVTRLRGGRLPEVEWVEGCS